MSRGKKKKQTNKRTPARAALGLVLDASDEAVVAPVDVLGGGDDAVELALLAARQGGLVLVAQGERLGRRVLLLDVGRQVLCLELGRRQVGKLVHGKARRRAALDAVGVLRRNAHQRVGKHRAACLLLLGRLVRLAVLQLERIKLRVHLGAQLGRLADQNQSKQRNNRKNHRFNRDFFCEKMASSEEVAVATTDEFGTVAQTQAPRHATRLTVRRLFVVAPRSPLRSWSDGTWSLFPTQWRC